MDEENEFYNIIGGQIYVQDQYIQKSQQKIIIENLCNLLQNNYPATYIDISQEIEEDSCTLSFPLESHSGLITIQFDITIHFKQKDIDFIAYFTEKHTKLIVHQKLLRLQFSRYTLRLNSGLRVGSFFINPLQGHIGFKLECVNSKKDLLFSLFPDYSEFMLYLETLIVTAMHSVRFHFMRILFMINRINLKLFRLYEHYREQVRYEDKSINKWRKFPSDAEMLMQRIKKVVKNQLHLEFNQQEYQIYGPIIKNQVKTENQCLIEIRPTNDNTLDVDQKCLIHKGGFSKIYSKEIKFHFKKDGEFQLQGQEKTLVIKVNNSSQGDKIKHETDILRSLSQIGIKVNDNGSSRLNYFTFSGRCPYIAQFYQVIDRSDRIVMERYYHSSLDHFKEKQQEVLSLATRIFIAHSIAMSLRYIHNYGIIHMDVKPANILIGKSLMAKLTDFGESINTGEIIDNVKPGISLPFCGPEILQKLQNNQFTYAYDIYSFGVLLFELLFDRYPTDFREQNFKSFEEKLQRQTYTVRYNEDFDQFVGPQYIMKYLGKLCIQCLQPNPNNRPNIDKIVLVLKDCLTYLDKVY